ncbi:hypothetical protein WDA79_07235 [Streptomyces sp. A475]|uniref:hypothetical protein n=1 Tax=unclassified Streptomyces TaxID=2593676 RepID=UPI0030C96488
MWGDGTPLRPRRREHAHDPHRRPARAFASNKKALPLIEDVLLDHDALIRGPEQGDDGIGLTVADYVKPDPGGECVITGADEPADNQCSIAAVDRNWSSEDFSFDIIDDDRLSARISLPDTGL